MALTQCRECGQPVSTEAIACPHCGAPQQRSVPPPLPPPAEQTIYRDHAVAVTTARVIIGSATYPLRNITSVKLTFTSPNVFGPMLVLLGGIFILFLTIMPLIQHNYFDAIPGIAMGASAILASVVWMLSLKTRYHVDLSTSSGEIHLLTSKDRTYIEKVAASINEALVR
jgi:hypothetical protein